MAKRLIDATNEENWAREHILDAKERSMILDFLRNCATVPAVEVVRCQDCKYWEKQTDSAKGCCLLSGNYPTGGWYCADGKRRDEGG